MTVSDSRQSASVREHEEVWSISGEM